jgi:hypothetical protein
LELKDLIVSDLAPHFRINFNDTLADLDTYLGDQSILSIPDIILVEVDPDEKCFLLIEKLRKNFLMNGLIIVMLSTRADKKSTAGYAALRLHDLYTYSFFYFGSYAKG